MNKSYLAWRLITFALLIQFSAAILGDDAPNLNKDCTDPANLASDACSLWLSVEDCKDVQPGDSCPHHPPYIKHIGTIPAHYHTVFNAVYDSCDTSKGPGHWLVVPNYPVIGVEDHAHRDPRSWSLAWDLAKDENIPTENIALAINPLPKRSKHQLHIHIGKLMDDMKSAINNNQIVPHDGHWHQVKLGNITYSAIFDDGPFTDPFTMVSKKVGEENMVCNGIIIAGSKSGFYVLHTGGTYNGGSNPCTYSVFVEGQLNYSCPP
ncbi:CDP-diacylglycerol diphosphatase [Methylobacter sp.]|uniref:CDP-diacylglycerol diphosphatase n=1 Tax=Methylobacter sp. TaxID=2051955 RepID=UPI003DA21549